MSKWIRKVVMVAVPSLLLVAALFRPDACCAFAPPAAAPAFDTHGEILDRGGTKYPISAIATPALIKHIQPVADMEEFESHIASKSKQVGYIKGHLALDDEKQLFFFTLGRLLSCSSEYPRTVSCVRSYISPCVIRIAVLTVWSSALTLVKSGLGLFPACW